MWWCCCGTICEVPLSDIKVEGWYFVVPPIPPLRVDLATIDLFYQADYIEPGVDAWVSNCQPVSNKVINSLPAGATHYRFGAFRYNYPGTPGDDPGACMRWAMICYTDDTCTTCYSGGSMFNAKQFSDASADEILDWCPDASGTAWALVSNVKAPFEETWNSGSNYLRIYAP
jgi:hypothetical protein